MAKFHGVIGYVKTEETAPGVYTETVTERICSGDILRNSRRWENAEQVNDSLMIENRFSIIAEDYIINNTQYMRYLKVFEAYWKITSFEIQRPRIILTVGGVYNGPTN